MIPNCYRDKEKSFVAHASLGPRNGWPVSSLRAVLTLRTMTDFTRSDGTFCDDAALWNAPFILTTMMTSTINNKQIAEF